MGKYVAYSKKIRRLMWSGIEQAKERIAQSKVGEVTGGQTEEALVYYVEGLKLIQCDMRNKRMYKWCNTLPSSRQGILEFRPWNKKLIPTGWTRDFTEEAFKNSLER